MLKFPYIVLDCIRKNPIHTNTEVLTQVEGNRSNYPVHKNTEVLTYLEEIEVIIPPIGIPSIKTCIRNMCTIIRNNYLL